MVLIAATAAVVCLLVHVRTSVLRDLAAFAVAVCFWSGLACVSGEFLSDSPFLVPYLALAGCNPGAFEDFRKLESRLLWNLISSHPLSLSLLPFSLASPRFPLRRLYSPCRLSLLSCKS